MSVFWCPTHKILEHVNVRCPESTFYAPAAACVDAAPRPRGAAPQLGEARANLEALSADENGELAKGWSAACDDFAEAVTRSIAAPRGAAGTLPEPYREFYNFDDWFDRSGYAEGDRNKLCKAFFAGYNDRAAVPAAAPRGEPPKPFCWAVVDEDGNVPDGEHFWFGHDAEGWAKDDAVVQNDQAEGEGEKYEAIPLYRALPAPSAAPPTQEGTHG